MSETRGAIIAAPHWTEAVWVAHAATILSTFFGALAVVLTRDLVFLTPPLGLAASRFAIGAAVVCALVAVLKPKLFIIPRGERVTVLGLGLLFFALFPILFTFSLQHTEATRGAMMLATMPMWSALLSWAIGVERLGPRRTLGMVIALVGVAIILSEKGMTFTSDGLLGDAMMLGTALTGAVYGLVSKRALTRTPVVTLIAWGMLAGSMLLTCLMFLTGQSFDMLALEGAVVFRIVALGVLGGAAAVYFWTFGLSRLAATQVAIYVNCNPVFATSLAVIFLGETVSWRFAIGALVVFSGVALVNWARASRDRLKPPEPV